MRSTAAPPRRAKKRRSATAKKKLSRQFKPQGMTLEEWQIDLRRQFGREQKLKFKNLGGETICP